MRWLKERVLEMMVIKMSFLDWQIEQLTGYKPVSTFYMDFSICERAGTRSVRALYNRVMKEWARDYKMLTELVMVLNWKIWQHYEKNEKLADLYDELYESAREYAETHLEGDELQYYYETTD